MTKRQEIMHALHILELVSSDQDGDVYATHERLKIGGEDIKEKSEYGKILIQLGFHFQNDGWWCFT